MARSWRTVRVFISSTFRDMHAERDHLIKAVFPELRDKLEKHRIHLVDIDLRWGVTAEQADNDRVLDLCLDEIKKSRPFFLGILGQRYGWVPQKLPDSAVKKHDWIACMAGRSITELEILHGVLNDPKMRMHSMFYFRKDDFLASVPKEIQDRVYLDGHGEKLKSVKDAIRKHCQNYGAPLREYPCAWDPDKPNPEDGTKGRIMGLEEFGQMVKKDLLAALSREYPELTQEAPASARPGSEDWLAEEADFHERFIEARLLSYVGREKVHRQLMDYQQGDSTKPLLLSGGSGTGKSSILGRLREEWSKDHPEDFVLPHFIGASPSSTDIRLTLRRLCLALRERFNITEPPKGGEGQSGGEQKPVPKEVPEELERLNSCFLEFLEAVPQGNRAVFIIDAVNQFDEYGGGQDMAWLPDDLPPGVKVVASCIDEPGKEQASLCALRRRNTPELKVEPLTNEERFEIVSLVPSVSAKSLDPRQIALLLDNPATTNPLYLTVALEELRGFGSFEKLNERIKSFPRTDGERGLVELFLQVIERLERELGQSTVFSLLSSIATSRNGLSEPELAEFLNRIRVGTEAATERAGGMLVALRQLRPYLLRRGPYVDFYHRNLYKAVRERYLFREDVRRGIHHALAEYFNWKGLKSERMLSETAHHMREAGMWDELDKLLTDLRFVEAKCAAGMTYALVRDYHAALQSLLETELEHRERVESYTRDLTAFARGEIRSLEIIASVRPWTDEEIDADSERIMKDPARIDRIKAFFQFVSSEAQALVNFGSFPGFCVQHAYNCMDSGPVGTAAERAVDWDKDNALVLRAPFHRRNYNPHPALLRTLEGHTDDVHSVSITPDGRRAVSGSEDMTLRAWDLETGQCFRTLRGHTEPIESVSITPDGKRAVSGSSDATLRVWDLEAGRCLRTLEGHTDRVNGVSVTPDGMRAVSGGQDKTVRLWDLERGRCLRTLEGHTDLVNGVSVAPDGKSAVSASEDKSVRVWDVESGRCLRTLEGHTDSVQTVSITPDGKRAVSGGEDKTLRVWDLETGQCLRTLEGHNEPVHSVSVTPDGRRAVSGSGRKTRLWDLEAGQCLRELEGHAWTVCSVSITSDGRRAVYGSWDKTLRVWDLETGRCRRTSGQGQGFASVLCVSVAPGGKRAVSGSEDRTLRAWDLETGHCLRILEGHEDEVLDVSITPDGKRAVSASDDGTLRAWDLETGQCLRTLAGHSDGVRSVGITPDGKRAVSGSLDHTLRVWDLETGQCLRTIEGHNAADPVLSVSMTPDGRRAVSVSKLFAPCVWDLETGRRLRVLFFDNPFGVSRISATPDGKRAVSGGLEGSLCVGSLETGGSLRTLVGHKARILSIGITPDGRRAVSGSEDETLRVWDLETGLCIGVYQAGAPVRSISGLMPAGSFAAGMGPSVVALTLRVPRAGPPLVTAARAWVYCDGGGVGRWENLVNASCPWCGRRFPVPAGTLELIGSITRKAGLKPEQSPCLELPAQAWDEPGLVSACPLCRKPLKYNPFFVDTSA